jgi:hypothetical protein
MHEEGRIGSSGYYGHDRSIDVDRENQELRKNIGNKLRENQFLRERVDALEFQKMDEDQRCATPNCSDGQLERPTKKEADRPPKTPKEAETTKEADRPPVQRRPRPPRRLIDPLMEAAQVLKDQRRLQTPIQKKRKRQLEIHQLRSPKSRWSFWP